METKRITFLNKDTDDYEEFNSEEDFIDFIRDKDRHNGKITLDFGDKGSVSADYTNISGKEILEKHFSLGDSDGE